MKNASVKIVFFLMWLTLIGAVFYTYGQSGLSIEEYPQFIREFVATYGIWGPVVYIILYTLRTLTFFSATVFTVAAGLIFDPWIAIVYVIIAENLSALLAFYVGRYFGQSIVERAGKTIAFFPKGEKMRNNGFITVLMMRLLFFPFDWVGYITGAYGVRARDVFLGTAIGTIPGLVAFVFLGGAFANPVQSLPLFIGFFVLGLIVAKVLKKRTKLGDELTRIKEQGDGK